MPRFRFRLERVLSVRVHEEERERLLFGAATRRKLEADMRLADVKEKIRLAIEHGVQLTAGRLTVEDLMRSHDYRVALMRSEAEAERAVDDAAVALELQRAKLIEARKKRRALELLREKRWKEWRASEENAEQNELEELGLASFASRQGDREFEEFAEASIAINPGPAGAIHVVG